MPDSPSDSSGHAAQLLKGAALLFAALGCLVLLWVGNNWLDYPEMRATQFGFEAPLWPALGVFVLLAVVAVVLLFWTAARRVDAGEDLFLQRHRRKSSEWNHSPNGEPQNRRGS